MAGALRVGLGDFGTYVQVGSWGPGAWLGLCGEVCLWEAPGPRSLSGPPPATCQLGQACGFL